MNFGDFILQNSKMLEGFLETEKENIVLRLFDDNEESQYIQNGRSKSKEEDVNITEVFNCILNENKQQKRIIKNSLLDMLYCMLKYKYQNDDLTKSDWKASIINSFKGMVLEFKDIGKGSLYKKFV